MCAKTVVYSSAALEFNPPALDTVFRAIRVRAMVNTFCDFQSLSYWLREESVLGTLLSTWCQGNMRPPGWDSDGVVKSLWSTINSDLPCSDKHLLILIKTTGDSVRKPKMKLQAVLTNISLVGDHLTGQISCGGG